MRLYVFNWHFSVQVIENINLKLMLLSSSKQKYQPFPLLSYFFPWSCVWDVCYITFCHVSHIHPGKTGMLCSSLLCSSWWVQIFGYVMACRSYSFFVHYTVSLSSLWKRICRYLNFWKVCQMYFVECVSKMAHILLVIHYSIYWAVCFQFAQFLRDGWENILLCLIIIIKLEVWTIIHCLGLGHEAMVCAVCLFIFL